ncbi:choice-of-anchor Q domain-containing protein, partial [Limnospira sp. Paracas R14]|uniref:choice-of-anchor Q domain-containing protein n=1 Tax=Limnospira sp. Paracas R14 TaxID=2981108 RepID=UPI0028E17BA6|nr:choice-of-anchor Q domain-containing protein [Limnospira sp. Paracas R14]
MEIISSTLRGNIAGRGGNTGTSGTGGAGGSGGGIYHANGEISLTNTTVVSNAAGARGMFSNSGTAGAGGRGGGIHLAGGELSLHNSTLSGNAAGTNAVGGGIFNAGSVVVHNTILAGNTAAGAQRDFAGTAATGSHNLFGIGGQSGFVNGVDGNLVGTLATPLDPRLGPLADNGGPTQTLALLPDSPALFAADAFAVLASDQRGIVRPQGVAPDIGAFETEVNASVTLGNLEQVFGSTSPPTATTDPVDLDVLIFYNGSTTFPTSTGTFDVRAVATGDGFFGGALDTLVI